MTNIKKIFSIFIILLFFFTKSNASITDALFVTVGDKAITTSDIVNEIKILLILNGQSFSEDKRKQLQSGALEAAIKRNVKKIEIEKYKSLKFSKEDLDNELNRIAGNLNMDLDTLKKVFIANEIDFVTVKDQIKTELLWNSLIFSLYKDRLIVNLDEINEQLKSYQGKTVTEEYLLSEIILKPVPANELDAKIKEVKNKIKNEGFKNVAMSLSISETALNGGELGWVNENIISESFKDKIINTPLGNISEPILLPEGILLLKVRDIKRTENILDLEVAKDKLVDTEKKKILNMHSLTHYDTLRRSISINYIGNE